ncbi:STAS domain-containing protein [Aquimarina sp. 2201CG5-10]|uniref:STAS domain-containing protein n=1 Tax=Aquimarina callyspongiae TaxID=3098150 RepID=UPI002AB3CE0C|nr:STAS domain-containing protein [Aquimarina sp. 2201CG5-10]MDY8134643.1 STAS domain-containing protein [Aquimarina sp. 2201CG5-10]
MTLKITNNYGVFEIKGNIVGANTLLLETHFEYLFEQLAFTSNQVILSLHKVTNIDAYGIHILKVLYKKAMRSNLNLCIIGKENKIVRDAFRRISYIKRYN